MKHLLFLLLITLTFSSGVGTRMLESSEPGQNSPINLNGIWVDNGNGMEVTVSQTGSAVKATYNSLYQCSRGVRQKTDLDFEGALSGNKISGMTSVCVYGQSRVQGGTIQMVPIKLTVSEDGKTMDGKYGQYGGAGDAYSVSLTRACKPDSKRLCDALANASLSVTNAIGSSAPASAASYAALKQNLTSPLSQIRNELCNNPAALRKLEEVGRELDSLNYQSGTSNLQNNLRLVRMEQGLKDLASVSCAGSSAAKGICKPGEKTVEPGDEQAKDSVVDGINNAIDQAKETAEAVEGKGGNAAYQIDVLNEKINKYKKMKAFWENIRASSCVPQDVFQTLNQVANDHRTSGHSENCEALCKASADWFGRMNPGSGLDIQKKFFTDVCLAYCN
jgi:hypothetical protein